MIAHARSGVNIFLISEFLLTNSNWKTARPQGKYYTSLHGVAWRAISQLTRGSYSRWRSRLVDRLLLQVEGGGSNG